ncbi:unnamed protein product [Macrosiphum euphorbiae]|uniref:HAT C-terminal dimerisation domain-containing protein n=1 Tax=Macrosiphum euphorbiae TaxID=13131 RepID=A0AAV0W2C5_9HEMI|nr:unnamed protein product [Macrosiphum euphorbiae]
MAAINNLAVISVLQFRMLSVQHYAEIEAFKFAPITSVDVERSFSRYKNVFRPNRHRFTLENLKKYMVAHCFAADHEDLHIE